MDTGTEQPRDLRLRANININKFSLITPPPLPGRQVGYDILIALIRHLYAQMSPEERKVHPAEQANPLLWYCWQSLPLGDTDLADWLQKLRNSETHEGSKADWNMERTLYELVNSPAMSDHFWKRDLFQLWDPYLAYKLNGGEWDRAPNTDPQHVMEWDGKMPLEQAMNLPRYEDEDGKLFKYSAFPRFVRVMYQTNDEPGPGFNELQDFKITSPVWGQEARMVGQYVLIAAVRFRDRDWPSDKEGPGSTDRLRLYSTSLWNAPPSSPCFWSDDDWKIGEPNSSFMLIFTRFDPNKFRVTDEIPEVVRSAPWLDLANLWLNPSAPHLTMEPYRPPELSNKEQKEDEPMEEGVMEDEEMQTENPEGPSALEGSHEPMGPPGKRRLAPSEVHDEQDQKRQRTTNGKSSHGDPTIQSLGSDISLPDAISKESGGGRDDQVHDRRDDTSADRALSMLYIGSNNAASSSSSLALANTSPAPTASQPLDSKGKLATKLWSKTCWPAVPFAGCGPFEIPLTNAQRRLYVADGDLESANAEFRDVVFDLVEEMDNHQPHQWRLGVWLTDEAILPPDTMSVDILLVAWNALVKLYTRLIDGRGVNLSEHLVQYKAGRREDIRRSCVVESIKAGAVEDDEKAVTYMEGFMKRSTDGIWSRGNPVPYISSDDMACIRSEVCQIIDRTEPAECSGALRKFAIEDPRRLRLPPKVVMWYALRVWRESCTEGSEEAEQVDCMLMCIIF